MIYIIAALYVLGVYDTKHQTELMILRGFVLKGGTGSFVFICLVWPINSFVLLCLELKDYLKGDN